MQIGNEGGREGKYRWTGLLKASRLPAPSSANSPSFISSNSSASFTASVLYWLVANNLASAQHLMVQLVWRDILCHNQTGPRLCSYAAENATQDQAWPQFWTCNPFFSSFCSRSISALFSSSAIYNTAFHSKPNWAIRSSIKSNPLFSKFVEKVMTKSGLSQ